MAPPPMPPCSRTPPTPPPSRTPPATLIGRTTLPPQGISASNDATALGAHRYRYTEAALETEDEHGFPYQYNPRSNEQKLTECNLKVTMSICTSGGIGYVLVLLCLC
ncbi:hypothetical protein E2562_029642 [Oryza meyeriana var. granulata]|uniref:Uncharacterized protein n=1 Tax=Oryza meyeriana var. granulata TaxID=110450 RepID=A0A6G1FDX5_9ORYZ|nr:hypothetical protein E2562_029642 [Oryza meyeriana var. granulata]